MDVLGSTRRPTIVNKLSVTTFKLITTPLFVTLDMFATVVQYFSVWLDLNNDG